MMVSLPIEYSDKKVTPFGGMSLLKEFVDTLGIREQLQTLPLPQGRSNRAYDASHVIESFWLSIWTGASRYIHADWLRYDDVLQSIFGFDSMPSQSTYSRFFHKFSDKTNTEVFPTLHSWLVDQVQLKTVTLDLDSTVINRCGQQEGAAKGYNPLKRGRNAHHPLIAFIEQTRMVANAWVRPGNTVDKSNCEAFLKETLHHALANKKVGLLRADSGFYSQSILHCLEDEDISYVIAAKLYKNIKHRVYGISDWVNICHGIDVAEMLFAHQGGKSRRYIIVRKQTDVCTKAAGKQLFDDPTYRFSCYVTNMTLPLDQIWNLYNKRADCENRIKELKQDFGLEQFCLKGFWATEASFRFIMIAYNIMSLFRFFALQSPTQHTLRTIRAQCFALGAWKANHANRTVLKIALPAKKRPWMTGLFSQIRQNAPPFVFSNA